MAALCDSQTMIEVVRSGDLAALDQMTACYGERLLRVGRRHCRTQEEAEDAVQDALLSAGEHLHSFRAEGSVEGWLVRMVANACKRMRRGRKNDPTLHEADAVLAAPSDSSPELLAGQAELAGLLGRALGALSPKDRLIFILAEGEGWTGGEIGEALGLSAGAVRSRLSRSRGRVKCDLERSLGKTPLLD